LLLVGTAVITGSTLPDLGRLYVFKIDSKDLKLVKIHSEEYEESV